MSLPQQESELYSTAMNHLEPSFTANTHYSVCLRALRTITKHVLRTYLYAHYALPSVC